jgi:CheY-like chemotaxis protein
MTIIIESANKYAQISHFDDGQKAIIQLQTIRADTEELPDIIFLDLSMPVMDGWQFLEEYATMIPLLTKKIGLYIVSSSISPHDVERSKRYSYVLDFLVKPVEAEKVASIIGIR